MLGVAVILEANGIHLSFPQKILVTLIGTEKIITFLVRLLLT